MAQALSRWQQLINVIQEKSLPEFKIAAFQKFSRHRFRGLGGWLLGLTALVALLLWNWKLLVATGTGVLVMLGVYTVLWNWKIIQLELRQFFRGANSHLAAAAATGSVAILSTYMAETIWEHSENHWIAAGAILQGLGTMAILVLLAAHMISGQASRDEASFNALVTNLTDADPLKRLIAVRQLTGLAASHRLDRTDLGVTLDCLRLMLSRETETLVREAILDGLQALDMAKQLPQGAPPLSVAVAKKRSAAKAFKRIP
ncbi:MAG: hypothetical protein MUC60_14345 [Oscillatoria sp. Prado101]|nr:hypothetical protein [Oscillatoria sp. Prado101]